MIELDTLDNISNKAHKIGSYIFMCYIKNNLFLCMYEYTLFISYFEVKGFKMTYYTNALWQDLTQLE